MSQSQESNANPYLKPAQASDPEPPRGPARQRKPAGTAQRIAGAFMILSGLLALLEAVLKPAGGPGASAALMVGPALIDMAIGITLLAGSSLLVALAMVRCGLGLTVGVALRASDGAATVVYQVLYCASLLGLLAGRAERARMAVAGSFFAICVLVQGVGILSLVSDGNPFSTYLLAAAGEIESTPLARADGRAAAYQVSFPNRKWYKRTAAAAARDNAVADLWFIRPDIDAHILIVAEHTPGKPLPVDAYTDAVIKNLKSETVGLEILSREPWASFPNQGRLFKARGKRGDLEIEWHGAVLTAFDRSYYLVGFASPKSMPQAASDMQAIFDSIRIPDAVLHAKPTDVDPTPISVVHGQKLPYSISAPTADWFLRKSDVVKAENAVIDRWLTRPELDAHVLVIAEEVGEGFTLPLAKYVEVVLANAGSHSERFTELHREPWGKFPNEGMRVRASLARDGLDLEYEYGIYTHGRRGFQIVGFTSKTSFETAQGEIARAIDSFEPPP